MESQVSFKLELSILQQDTAGKTYVEFILESMFCEIISSIEMVRFRGARNY